MGLAAEGEMMGLLAILAGAFTFLLNGVGLALRVLPRFRRVSLHLGIFSAAVAVLTLLLLAVPGGLYAVGFALPILSPGIVLSVVSIALARRRRTGPRPEESPPAPGNGPLAVAACVVLFTMVASCAGLWPLMNVLSYMHHGRWPADIDRSDIKEGMTAGDIQARYGRPHESKLRDGKQEWIYYGPGPSGQILLIEFDAAGRVTRTGRLD